MQNVACRVRVNKAIFDNARKTDKMWSQQLTAKHQVGDGLLRLFLLISLWVTYIFYSNYVSIESFASKYINLTVNFLGYLKSCLALETDSDRQSLLA